MPAVIRGSALATGDGATAIINTTIIHEPPKDGKASNPAEVDNIFVQNGRGSLLKNHYQEVLSDLAKKRRVICIHGPGGSGKTTLAEGEAVKEDSPYLLRFQIAADSYDALFNGLEELYARFYGQNECDLLKKENNEQRKRRRLLSGLKAKLKAKEWHPAVLLLDNCKQEMEAFLREVIGALNDTHFLITTRNSRLLASPTTSKNPTVGQLPVAEGWSLENRLQFIGEDLGELKARKALASYLPFPLGLKVADQTIRYLHETNASYDCKCYLSEIRVGKNDDNEIEALEDASEDITQRQTAVLGKAMELIRGEEGETLLQFLGHLSSVPIPYNLVNNYFNHLFKGESESGKPKRLRKGLRQLQALSLVDTQIQSGSIQTLRIHELVQDISRRKFLIKEIGWLPWFIGEESSLEIMLNTLMERTPIDDSLLHDENNRKRMKVSLRHLEALLKNVDNNEAYIGRAYFYLSNAYCDLGNPHKEKEFMERALTIFEGYYKPDHPNIAATLTNLGNAYGALGNPHKQKELLERALTILEGYYKSDHPKIAITLTNLGNAYADLGNPHKQKKLLERALTIFEGYYKSDHPKIAVMLASLGNAYGDLGNPHKKKELLERALRIKEGYYKPDHPEIAITLTNLGNAYGGLGQVDKQKELLERALTIFEGYYEPNHPHIAITLNILGIAYGNLGDPKKSKELFESALTIGKAYYGENHVAVAEMLTCLGNTYRALKEHYQAIKVLQRALTIKEEFYGSTHYKVSNTLTYLGDAYRDSNKNEDSLASLTRALPIKAAHYGESNYKTGKTHYSLGRTLQSLGDFSEAENHFLIAYAIFKDHYGEKHGKTKEVLSELQALKRTMRREKTSIFHPMSGDQERCTAPEELSF